MDSVNDSREYGCGSSISFSASTHLSIMTNVKGQMASIDRLSRLHRRLDFS